MNYPASRTARSNKLHEPPSGGGTVTSVGGSADAVRLCVRRFAGLFEGVIGNEGRLRLAPEAAAARVAIGLRWRAQFRVLGERGFKFERS